MFKLHGKERDFILRVKLLSVGGIKVKQKAIASTQHLAFSQTKIKGGAKSGPKRRENPCTISHRH